MNILVADDSEDTRFLLRIYCEGTAFHLTFAEDGERAVAAYQSGSYDLIVMDVQMPVMDGLTATRRIRSIEAQRETRQAGRRIPILALTANALSEDLALALDAGCDGQVVKPISKKAFLFALEQWRAVETAGACPLLIEIPEGLEELARNYLASCEHEVTAFKGMLDRSDFGEMRRVAHNFKGSGTSYGFPDISRLGGSMERASSDRNTAVLIEGCQELSDYIQAANRQMEFAS